MTRASIRSAATVAIVAFCIALLTRTVGPLSDENTTTHRVVESLIIAALAVALASAVDFMVSRSHPQPSRVVEVDPATRTRVADLIAAGKKVQAVKVVREATGADLKTAVDTVESFDERDGSRARP